MLEIKHLSKQYQEKVLDDISMLLPSTGIVTILGKSGCGKTTLLNIIGGLDTKYQGSVLFNGIDIKQYKGYHLHVGYLFQQFHLIEWLLSYQNIMVPKYFRKSNGKKQIDTQLSIMQLSSLKRKRIVQLSGGQKQRIALLRAINGPIKIILCDEPTASLDKDNAIEVFKQLKTQAKDKLVIVVSHSKELASQYGDICIEMKDGKILSINKEIENKIEYVEKQKEQPWYKIFPLSLLQALSKWKRNVKICSGVSLALVCILLTFTLSTGLQKQIKSQLHQLLPNTTVTLVSKEKKPIAYQEIDTLTKDTRLKNIYVEVEGYEFIGIGKTNTYNEQEVLYIGDTTKSLPNKDTLLQGTIPSKKEEIILSKSTAKHLTKGEPIEPLLNTKVYGFYLQSETIKSIELEIVGVSKETTTLDTIYYPKFSNVETIKELYTTQDIFISLGLLEIEQGISTENIIKQLSTQYPQFTFTASSLALEKQIDDIIQQVHLVLLCFCVLAIISSCFLIGEVLFLSNVERIKEIGIFKCFGATKAAIRSLTFIEAISIVTVSFFMSYLIFENILQIINDFVATSLSIETGTAFITIDFMIIIIVYIVAILLALVSSILPAIYASRIDVVKALKQ